MRLNHQHQYLEVIYRYCQELFPENAHNFEIAHTNYGPINILMFKGSDIISLFSSEGTLEVEAKIRNYSRSIPTWTNFRIENNEEAFLQLKKAIEVIDRYYDQS